MPQTSKDIVIQILKRNPKARNSDMVLFVDYMQMMGMKLQSWQIWLFEHLPYDMETITRSRRVVQNDEKQLQATPEVKKARLKKEIEIREKHMKKEWIFNPETNAYYQDYPNLIDNGSG